MSDYRKAILVRTNLVEGVGQKSAREFARFIRIALNSSNEPDYHLLIARDLEVMQSDPYRMLVRQTIEVRKMLHGLLRKVESRAKEDAKKKVQPGTGYQCYSDLSPRQPRMRV